MDLKASVRQGQEYRLSSARAKIGARVQLTGVFVVINEGWRGEGFVRKEDGLTARRSGIDRPRLHSAVRVNEYSFEDYGVGAVRGKEVAIWPDISARRSRKRPDGELSGERDEVTGGRGVFSRP